MGTILDDIEATKWREIEAAKRDRPAESLTKQLASMPPVRNFTASLIQPGMRIIAEVKKASPSAGVIRADFDPVKIATIYSEHGADCLSVLTDRDYFQGDLGYLTAIHEAVPLPCLRKEFILDRYQLLEARVAGADAVLLIAEILPGQKLKELYSQARELGLDVLIELHDAEELSRVVDTGCVLIGINNRDLRTFRTSLDRTLSLIPKIPIDRVVVSESGIKTHLDLFLLEQVGAKAVLVGELLMRSPDIGEALDTLRGVS
jgi:indole-3-glycerol phosphate synthase